MEEKKINLEAVATINQQSEVPQTERNSSNMFWSLSRNGISYFLMSCFGLLLLCLLISIIIVTSTSIEVMYSKSSTPKPVYSSCAGIAESSPLSASGYYVIQSSNGSLFQVYCEMGTMCGGGRRGWTRALGPNQYTSVTIGTANSCVSIKHFANQGVNYSRLCGQIIGFYSHNGICAGMNSGASIDESYVHGLSITHGTPRRHIWTLAMVLYMCVNDTLYNLPQFVGKDYVKKTM